MAELPFDLIERIRQEAVENDDIYRQRPEDILDLSRQHYCHVEMLNWAISQLGNLKGARILDVGIGEGFSSVMMALAGAQVTGIEVSGVALARAEKLAKRCGVTLNLQEMPGEDLRFEKNSFDGILCMSAYHHMDQERAASEFDRVLRPTGRLAMMEPLASNPPAWFYRRIGGLFSRAATSRETPLRVRDLKSLRKYFAKVEWRGMYLLSVGLLGMERLQKEPSPWLLRFTQSAFRWSSPLDSALLRIPGLQRIAWKMAIVAER
ncbi:MAG TPA: methyltransferase domain-containing protein [Candidatus Sulfotelmatobacter sp.]|jgi:2-polyprenyl-3-methyl-5-hydroxy-6-metoxy-1,4-benzoquinol methylase|nr:methyltransferase domain-containing protein [Candidatus Sulfotelmatobacter sp.]